MNDRCDTCNEPDAKVFATFDGVLWCSTCIRLTMEAPTEALEAFTTNVNFGAVGPSQGPTDA